MTERLLILGGTAEARELANHVAEELSDAVSVTTALAGRTEHHADIAGAVRIGGFGGARGFADYLAAENIRWVIDATHPFAERISANAHDACVLTDIPRLTLRRPPHPRRDGVNRIVVASLADAADLLPRIAKRAFLAVGRQGASAFAAVEDVYMVVRVIDGGPLPLPPDRHTVIVSRPPFSGDNERRLLRDHAIDTLVARNSGAPSGETKLQAADSLGVRVLLVDPPPPEPGPIVGSVEEAVSWLHERIGTRT